MDFAHYIFSEDIEEYYIAYGQMTRDGILG
jgi:hypothetical protein